MEHLTEVGSRLYYTSEQNILLLIALLKKYNIRKVVASPGATNVTFVSSIQQDSFFEMYSCVDERSAGYMAVGLCEESSEPVLLSCTGATASRNYLPALTEAYYRKLPLIACTSAQDFHNIGHLIAQVINRNNPPSDVVLKSVNISSINNESDRWFAEIKLNDVLEELFRRGGGPIHINLETKYSLDYSAKELPKVRKISRITNLTKDLPQLPQGKIGVFVGSHKKWTSEESFALESFAISNNAIVFVDHTSNYHGKNALNYSIKGSQEVHHNEPSFDVIIHIGEVSGDYYTMRLMKNTKQVWRVNPDGEMRDTFKKLSFVFEMTEQEFFERYSSNTDLSSQNLPANSFYEECMAEKNRLLSLIPDLPFSNIYIAKQIADKMPENSVLHLGILNSLRAWNLFDLPKSVNVFSNVGGFGIDGCLSSMIGTSLVNKDRLYFGVFGDLATFYDLNVLANRHLGSNLRIMLINNGLGQEFKNYNHPGARFKEKTDDFIAAKGHNGKQSPLLMKHFTEDLGFEYLSVSNKEEFSIAYPKFLNNRIGDKPLFFEVFTNSEEENDALYLIKHIEQPTDKEKITNTIKQTLKNTVGDKLINKIKKL
ncbi:MAG: thiamine pyrophosphate-binding protein [Bacteroidales bacterium]|nr:thiamine pyrophosphate-binding protein [Bacteroidales bacterium]